MFFKCKLDGCEDVFNCKRLSMSMKELTTTAMASFVKNATKSSPNFQLLINTKEFTISKDLFPAKQKDAKKHSLKNQTWCAITGSIPVTVHLCVKFVRRLSRVMEISSNICKFIRKRKSVMGLSAFSMNVTSFINTRTR